MLQLLGSPAVAADFAVVLSQTMCKSCMLFMCGYEHTCWGVSRPAGGRQPTSSMIMLMMQFVRLEELHCLLG